MEALVSLGLVLRSFVPMCRQDDVDRVGLKPAVNRTCDHVGPPAAVPLVLWS